jgi:hypothetical protein
MAIHATPTQNVQMVIYHQNKPPCGRFLHPGATFAEFVSRSLFVACVFVIQSFFTSAGKADNITDKCVASIERIKSFDVTYRLDILVFGNDVKEGADINASNVGLSFTNRDVFARGLGRRIEDSVGQEDHSIAVIDWKTATRSGRPLSESLRKSLPGLTYGDYVNPIEDRLFLTDLLRDKHTVITPLAEKGAEPGWSGFTVSNPHLNGQLQLWLDADHGYLPASIESYSMTASGERVLRQSVRIERFIEYAENCWAPAKMMSTVYQGVDKASKKALAATGKVVEIDENRSKWNTIQDGKLFLAASLPTKNYSANGWNFDYPPDLLKLKQQADTYNSPQTPKILWLLILVIALLPLIFLFYGRHNKSHANASTI